MYRDACFITVSSVRLAPQGEVGWHVECIPVCVANVGDTSLLVHEEGEDVKVGSGVRDLGGAVRSAVGGGDDSVDLQFCHDGIAVATWSTRDGSG